MSQRALIYCVLWCCSMATAAIAQPLEHFNSFPQPGTTKDDHRTLEVDGRFLAGLSITGLVSAVSMSVGVGGGGILVPVFHLLVGFGIKMATALSQSSIAAAGIGSVVYSLTHPHPTRKDTPLIDVDLACILTPSLLMGISLGVILNTVSPPWLITFSVASVLCYMAARTGTTAIKLRKKETMSVVFLDGEEMAVSDESGGGSTYLGEGLIELPRLDPPPPSPTYRLRALLQVTALWAVIVLFQVLKSQTTSRCTWQFAAYYTTQLAVATASTLLFIHRAAGTTPRQYVSDNEQPLLVSPRSSSAAGGWGRQALTYAALAAVCAGFIAGLIGIGGGMLLNPMMVELGVDPSISAATSGLMVLYASTSATAFFIAEGRFNAQYAAAFGLVCVFSTFTGSKLLSGIVKKHGASILVFLVAGVIATGAVCVVLFDGPKALQHLLEKEGFKPFC